MEQKKIELIQKLRALAENGVGGEKEGAQRKLEQLMEKYRIKESDLDDESQKDFEFKFHNDLEKRLLDQIMYKVIGKDFLYNQYHYVRGKGAKTTSGIRCTKAQGIQIGIEYEFYLDLWKEEQEFFFQCFVQKHKLFQTSKEKKLEGSQDYSKEEWMRMQAAMNTMQDKSIIQRLEGGE